MFRFMRMGDKPFVPVKNAESRIASRTGNEGIRFRGVELFRRDGGGHGYQGRSREKPERTPDRFRVVSASP